MSGPASGTAGAGAGAAEAWLSHRAALAPEAPALVFEGRVWTYAELAREVGELARALAERGVGEGTLVAALLANGPGYVRLLHALRALGAVLLPLSWRLTPAELLHPLRDSGAAALVFEAGEFESVAAQLGGALPDLAAWRMLGTGIEAPGRGGGPSSVASARRLPGAAAVLYTSGTTGLPKGAVLGAEQLEASARASARLLGAAPDDRWLVCLPLFHIGGLSIPLRCCLAGSCALIHERFDAQRVARAIDEAGVTQASLVAAMLEGLLEQTASRPPPASLRWLLVGGGRVPAALLERAWAAGWPIATTYGLTEAASQVATRLPADRRGPHDGRLHPLPGSALRILDEDGRDLAAGATGEICVRGPHVMRGYLGRERESERALREGWLHTGDIGALDEEGLLRVFERRDDLIVSGGENIYPAEIEAVLLRHPAVAEAAVVGRPDARFGQRPLAYWVAAEWLGEDLPEPALEAHCRAQLAPFKRPVGFRRVPALPRGPSGKLLRRELREGG